MRVFVNAGAVDLPAGADVAAAVREFDPALEQQIASGTAYVTDGCGIEIDPAAPLQAGAILRVVVRARRRSGNGHADT
ncbi:MAG: hypothetical protein ACXWWK_00025 [Gemmatimonadales bacterium]